MLSQWLVGDEMSVVENFQKEYGYNQQLGIYEKDYIEGSGQSYEGVVFTDGGREVIYYDEQGARRYYVGGALGVDMWAGELILRLKEQPGYGDIELVVVLPFKGHDAKWDERGKRRMDFLLRMCSDCVVVAKEDCRESYIKRNCYMVDHADYLVAVYDNERNLRSGTMQTVRYAEKCKLTITFINPDTGSLSYLYGI